MYAFSAGTCLAERVILASPKGPSVLPQHERLPVEFSAAPNKDGRDAKGLHKNKEFPRGDGMVHLPLTPTCRLRAIPTDVRFPLYFSPSQSHPSREMIRITHSAPVICSAVSAMCGTKSDKIGQNTPLPSMETVAHQQLTSGHFLQLSSSLHRSRADAGS